MKKKNFILSDIEVIDAGAEGKAVAKVDGLTVFIPMVIPGDIVDVEVFKKKKNYAEARLVELKKPSPDRIDPQCEHFGLCGGCKWQMLNYDRQLFYKQKQVEDNFMHLGKFPFPPVSTIMPSDQIFFYRNKLEFTFSNLRWLDNEDMIRQKEDKPVEFRGLGFHIPAKFDKVLDIHHCCLQPDPSNAIRNAVKTYAIEHEMEFYNLRKHEGLLRNLIIRISSLQEVMVILSVTNFSDSVRELLDFMVDRFPIITSLQYVVNTKMNDSISDLEIILYKGKSFITDTMEDLQFNIGPLSFYQTNSKQAYKLYSVARDFAAIEPENIVYDLYTGTGTIANFIARKAKKVVGIEYVDAAVEDAKQNSLHNHIENTRFFAGDMKDILTLSFVQEHGKPDVVITDPPRAGMHAQVVERILEIEAPKVVYISCNPATQARDITLLAEKYAVKKIQPVDMFPQTQHVENVVLLTLK